MQEELHGILTALSDYNDGVMTTQFWASQFQLDVNSAVNSGNGDPKATADALQVSTPAKCLSLPLCQNARMTHNG